MPDYREMYFKMARAAADAGVGEAGKRKVRRNRWANVGNGPYGEYGER